MKLVLENQAQCRRIQYSTLFLIFSNGKDSIQGIKGGTSEQIQK